TDVLQALKAKNITPEWVQVGNETNDGMLWEDGRASVNRKNFAELVQAGYDAVKKVDTNILVIVHLSNGSDKGLYQWIFEGLQANGTKWDVIGMSLYPSPTNWQVTTTQCLDNMSTLVNKYQKPIMICEIGMPWDAALECRKFIKDIVAKNKSLGTKGLGVFYWEPQSYGQWKGYTLGAFDNSGKPTVALNGFTD
ncbi:MAG: glycosyl hydrolase 53 family protein, partial [Chitinophagaceae bacterium]